MASKREKERKARLEQRRAETTPPPLKWREELDRLEKECKDLTRANHNLRSEKSLLQAHVNATRKEADDLRGLVKHNKKLTDDMLKTHTEMKHALEVIRNLHRINQGGVCEDCLQPWPCRTLRSVGKIPLQAVITNLMKLEQELK
jgi:chromosome segregation ATPase